MKIDIAFTNLKELLNHVEELHNDAIKNSKIDTTSETKVIFFQTFFALYVQEIKSYVKYLTDEYKKTSLSKLRLKLSNAIMNLTQLEKDIVNLPYYKAYNEIEKLIKHESRIKYTSDDGKKTSHDKNIIFDYEQDLKLRGHLKDLLFALYMNNKDEVILEEVIDKIVEHKKDFKKLLNDLII